MPKPSSSFYAFSGFVSLIRIFFFSSERECTRAIRRTQKAQTRREDSEPCFLNRAFARLQRRDDLSPLSATTQGSRTSALGRLRFELTNTHKIGLRSQATMKTIKTTEID